MHRDLQFDMRENPASGRRHGSRLAVSTKASSHHMREENEESVPPALVVETVLPAADDTTHAAPSGAATGGRGANGDRLLTVHEVAELLRVPVSWVYGRTRKRSLERLPGYRLGKYWRFSEEEIHAWVKRQGRGAHSA